MQYPRLWRRNSVHFRLVSVHFRLGTQTGVLDDGLENAKQMEVLRKWLTVGSLPTPAKPT
jgi:hypothetical protein